MLINDVPQGVQADVDSVSLKDYLTGIGHIIKQHARKLWVSAEISKLQDKNHLYIDLVEHDADGKEVAKAQARVWANRKPSLLARFKEGTGADLEAGIKVLLRVEASFNAQFGFALIIDDIDPSYTLGDMERKLIEIRREMKEKGYYDMNRQRTAPVDFTRVAVISPPEAAGLGDFQANADKLMKLGLCRFDYYSATFQGASAPAAIFDRIVAVWNDHQAAGADHFDAVVIIRGGGALTDLAWLNDRKLAAAVCRLPIPVFTGIGHQQDNTILDELCHTRFDTPSKVIGHIQNVIVARAREAMENWRCIRSESHRMVELRRTGLGKAHEFLTTQTASAVRLAALSIAGCMTAVTDKTHDWLRAGQREMDAHWREITLLARSSLDCALVDTQNMKQSIETHALNSARQCQMELDSRLRAIHQTACHQVADATSQVKVRHAEIVDGARNQVALMRQETEFRLREAVGYGPRQTLERGYALVRGSAGVVTSAAKAAGAAKLEIEFADGRIEVAPVVKSK